MLRSRPGSAAAGSLLSGLFSQGILAISGILLARYLGPENRGYLALFVLIPLAISQLGELGLPTAAAYHIAKNPCAARTIVRVLRGPFLAQCLLLSAVQALVMVAVFSRAAPTVYLAALASVPQVSSVILLDYGLAILQGQQRFLSFNVLRTVPGVFNAFAAVAVWRGKADLVATTILLMLAALLAGAITVAVALGGLRRLGAREPAPTRTSMLRFGTRSLIGSLYPIETFRLEQLLIGWLLSPATLGIYVAAVAFTNLPRFVAQSLGLVAYPRIAAQRSLIRRRQLTWRYFLFSTALCSLTVATLELVIGPLVPALFGERFAAAVPVARLLLVGTLFLSARRILAESLKGAGYPGAGTVAEMVSLALLLIVMLPLTDSFGLLGVAASVSVAGAGSLAVVLWFHATKPALSAQRLAIVSESGTRGKERHR
ncbi:MAG: oligosaccharide flippase family protein [Candidatus Dormibacteraeota bacterium]|nr:oligosaccharide flippase family protein [Candidatus Dormibacteraeota bacterium]